MSSRLKDGSKDALKRGNAVQSALRTKIRGRKSCEAMTGCVERTECDRKLVLTSKSWFCSRVLKSRGSCLKRETHKKTHKFNTRHGESKTSQEDV